VVKLRECLSAKSGTYATREKATEELNRIRTRSDREVKPIRVYECTLGCRGWHLTSQPLRQTKAKRRR
jgi:hypothetical protein